MGADCIVVFAPFLDDDLCLSEGVKYLAVEQLVPEAGIEALAVSVFPRRPRHDIGGRRTDRGNPVPNSLGNELGSVVGPDKSWRPPQDELVRQHIDHVDGVEFSLYPDHQALLRVLVDEVQRPEGPTVMGTVMDEVI